MTRREQVLQAQIESAGGKTFTKDINLPSVSLAASEDKHLQADGTWGTAVSPWQSVSVDDVILLSRVHVPAGSLNVLLKAVGYSDLSTALWNERSGTVTETLDMTMQDCLDA